MELQSGVPVSASLYMERISGGVNGMCILPAVYLFMLRAIIRLAGKGADAVLISAAVPGILFIAG